MHYILQIIVLQLVFLLVYELFLKQETFYRWNRLYLIITSLLAIALPKIQFSVLENVVPTNYIYILPTVNVGATTNNIVEAPSILNTFSSIEIIYVLGFVLTAILFFKKLYTLIVLLRKSKRIKYEQYTIVLLAEKRAAFSFLNYIFIHDVLFHNEKLQIIAHEQIHIKQKHSWDLLFFELQKIIFWFNPLVYIYQKRIAEIHEFLTDDLIIKQIDKRTYFNLLLNEVFSTENIAFTNQFYNYSLIKKRIIMATKNKSKKVRLVKYLLLIPVLTLTLIYTSCNKDSVSKNDTSENTENLITLIKIEKEKDLVTITTKNIKNMDEEGNVLTMSLDEYNSGNYADKYKNVVIAEKSETSYKQIKNTLKPPTPPTPPNPDAVYRQFSKDAPALFRDLSKAPIFPGCEQSDDLKACFIEKLHEFVRTNFNYPEAAKNQGISGRVYVSFVIDTNGNVTKLKMRGPNPILENEAKRIISLLPTITPGEVDGKPVAMAMALPIAFRLAE